MPEKVDQQKFDSPWLYIQTTGELYRPDGSLCGIGYSGKDGAIEGNGKNNPNLQHVRNVGPIPQGFYMFSNPIDHPKLGACAIYLDNTPFIQNIFGRGAFYMHGDNRDHTASLGCIIMPIKVRKEVATQVGKYLRVIRDLVGKVS